MRTSLKTATIGRLLFALSLVLIANTLFAQTWTEQHSRRLLLPSSSSDPSRTVAIEAGVLDSSYTLRLPGTNAVGLLLNEGAGTLSWVDVLTGANGGTGSQYVTFTTGGTTSHVYTLPDQDATLLSSGSGVMLQNTTPGVTQNGNANINGVFLAGSGAFGDVNVSNNITLTGANKKIILTGNSTGASSFSAGNQGTSNISYVLPVISPADGQVLSSDNAGNMSWIMPFVNPMTTIGDIIYGGRSGDAMRLGGNTTTTKKFLTQTGTGLLSQTPSWDTIAQNDVAGLSASSSPTFRRITLTDTSDQVTLGTTKTITLTAPTPIASRTYTLPDAGNDASFIMSNSASEQAVNSGLQLNGYLEFPHDTITIVGSSSNDNVVINGKSWLHVGASGTIGADTITGFISGPNPQGRMLRITNLTGANLILANNNTGSLAANRIITGTGADITISNGGGVELDYDDHLGGWILSFTGGITHVELGGTGATGFTQNGILYGAGALPIQATSAAANSVLVTNGSSVPSLSQTLPSAVQSNITSLTGLTGAITYPTGLTFNGTAARTATLARNTSNNLPGQDLTIQSGAPLSFAPTNDLAGGNLILSSGISEGIGSSSIVFQTPSPQVGSSNVDNTPATRLTLNSTQLNLGADIELDQNGTQRISSSGVGNLSSLTLASPLTGANGGTGSQYVTFTGPSSPQTYTLPATGGILTTSTSGVQLQGSTPGTTQTGNANISGTMLAGRVGVGTTSPQAALDIEGSMIFGVDSVTIVGSSTNNNVSAGSRVNLSIGMSGTAGPATITGFTGGAQGRYIKIANLTGETITLANMSLLSGPGSWIYTGTADLELPPSALAALTYSTELMGWAVEYAGGVTTAVSSGGTGSTNFAQNGILYGNGTAPIQVTSAAPNSILVTDGSNVPSLSQHLPSTVLNNIDSLPSLNGPIQYPTSLTFDGTGGRMESVARNNSNTLPGQGLTIQAGAPLASASTNNLAGGNLTLSSGISEGTGTSNIYFQTAASGSTGNTDNIPATRLSLNATQLNLMNGVDLLVNGTTRISSAGAGTLTSLTLGSALTLANGGTGTSLTASNGGVFYSTGSAGAILAGTSTANQVLLSGSNSAPVWSSATYPASTTAKQLLYSSTTNTITGLATANNGVLVTDGSGVPSIGSTLPNAVQDNITRIGTIASWGSTIVPIANGGTGSNSATSALKALTPDTTGRSGKYLYVQPGGGFVWSAAGSGNGSVTSVNVSGGTTGLTTSGGPVTTTGTITLAGTLSASNGGTGQTSIGAAFRSMVPDTSSQTGKFLYVIPGGGFGWSSVGTGNGTVTSVGLSGGTTGLTVSNSPVTASGTMTLGGTLAVANGGTGQSSALTAGGIIYGASATAMSSTGAGSSGQLLISGGSGAPSFTSSISGLTITNSSIGSSNPSTGAFTTLTASTSTTTPVLYGGTANGASLNLQSTSGGTPSGDYITLTTGGSEKIRLDNGGHFGIGTSTPRGTLDINGTLVVHDDTVTITGNTQNHNVSSGSQFTLHVGLTGVAGPDTITGLSGGVESRIMQVINLTGQDLTFLNQSSSSTAGNRITTGTGSPVTIPLGGIIQLQWDEELGGWAVDFIGGGSSVSSGGTGATSFTQNGILYGNGSSPIQATSAGANSVLVTNGSNIPSLSQTLPSVVQSNITALTGMTGTITYPTGLTFNGTTARTASLSRNTSNTLPGQGLTVQAGAPLVAASTNNLAGGDLTLSSGISEGSGSSSIILQTPTPGGSSNTDNSLATRATINSTQFNLGSGIELDFNGTQRISSTGAGTLASLTLGSPLTLSNGGTGASLTASNGGIFYSTGSAAAILAGTATAGQILRSGASSAPSWSTATYPATAGTAGNFLRSDGTNFVSSAITPSDIGSAGVQYGPSSTQTTITTATTKLFDIAYGTIASGTALAGAAITADGSAVTNGSATGLTITSKANGSGTATGLSVTTSGGIAQPNIVLHNTSGARSYITTTDSDLYYESTGDIYGTSRLHLQNRTGSNGALFEMIPNAANPGVNLVDFGFKPGTGVQSNLRLEARTSTIRNTANQTFGEFELFMNTLGVNSGTPTYNFSTGEGASTFEVGNVGIGMVNPTQKLQVQNGNLFLSNNSGTADSLIFQGTSSGRTSLRAGAQGATNINYVLPITAPASNGQVLSSTTGGTMSWITPGTGSVTSVGMTVPGFLSISGSPITSSGTLAVGYSGTALPVANGGTGSTTAFTPGSVVFAGTGGTYSQDNTNFYWDDVNNTLRLGGGSVLPNSVSAASGSLNSYLQITEQNQSNGSSASTDIVATADNGTDTSFYIDMGINSSGYSQAAYSNGGPNAGYLYNLGGNLIIGPASPGDSLIFQTGGNLSSNKVMSFNGSGIATLQKYGAGALYTNSSGLISSGVLPLANGGTNANLTASNGGIFYSTGSAGAILTGTATAGQILQSGANSAPSWSTATYPATASTAGNTLKSNGTNFVSTAPNYYQGTPTNPAGTTNTTGVMMGLGGAAKITPSGSGKVLIIISGTIDNTTTGGAGVQIRFGTGTAPSNGSTTLAGTVAGALVTINNSASGDTYAFSLNAIVSMSIGVANWMDVSLKAISTGTAAISNLSISAVEL